MQASLQMAEGKVRYISATGGTTESRGVRTGNDFRRSWRRSATSKRLTMGRQCIGAFLLCLNTGETIFSKAEMVFWPFFKRGENATTVSNATDDRGCA